MGGGTCAAAGHPIPEACSDLFLLVPWPQRVWAGLGSTSAARRTFCERFAGPSVGGGTRVAAGDPVPIALSDLLPSVSRPWQGRTPLPDPAPSPWREGPPWEFRRSLQSRNLPRSNTLWSLGAEFALAWSSLSALWFVGSELCVCASFYFAIFDVDVIV